MSDLNKYGSNDESFVSNLEKEGKFEGKSIFEMFESDDGDGKL